MQIISSYDFHYQKSQAYTGHTLITIRIRLQTFISNNDVKALCLVSYAFHEDVNFLDVRLYYSERLQFKTI